MTEDHRQNLGKAGEDLACRELARRGYAILARRYRTRLGEIDIVADDHGTLVFVEVKTRADDRCGSPAEAVTRRKQRRLARMAADYLARSRGRHRPCRFDVVAVRLGPAAPVVTRLSPCLRPGVRGSVPSWDACVSYMKHQENSWRILVGVMACWAVGC